MSREVSNPFYRGASGGLAVLHLVCEFAPPNPSLHPPIATHRPKETPMLVNKAANREWVATDYPGIERSLFRRNETGGRSSVVRLARGSRFPRHAHQGTEKL